MVGPPSISAEHRLTTAKRWWRELDDTNAAWPWKAYSKERPRRLQKFVTLLVEKKARAKLLADGSGETVARYYNHQGELGSQWLTVFPQERMHSLTDSEFCYAVRSRLGVPTGPESDRGGHQALTRDEGRTIAHHEIVGLVVELLGWIGGLRVRNLDKPLEDLSDTPFAGVHRPDIRVDEPGMSPAYIDISLTHWWSTGGSRGSADKRAACTATPAGAVDTAFRRQLVRDYRTDSNVWPGCTLILGIFSTGGRAHHQFAAEIRGWCRRAAERRGGVGAIDVASDFAGLFYRVSSALSVRIQQISSRLVGSSLVPGSYLSRAEAGTPDFWEATVAAAGSDFTADIDEALR